MSSLEDVVEKLVLTALGKEKAELIVENGTLINVFTGELIENTGVAVAGGRIAIVGKTSHVIGPNTIVINARGKYLAPGFLDGHVHIESSMLTVTQFAKAVLPHGTTSVFIDPHEIANVMGLEGVRIMHDEGARLPLKVYVSIPSCVPAAGPVFETAGSEIGVEEVKEGFSLKSAIALGEVMNYPGVLSLDHKMIGEIKMALKHRKVVEGHFYGNLEEELNAYVATGISSDHESITMEAGLAKLRLGVYVMVREGSAWKDVKEVIRMVTKKKIDHRRVCLVTDDREPSDILREGHIDHVVRRAIEEGVDPVKAIQMATLNTAEHFKVDFDIGSLAPGRIADILILKSLENISIETVIANGLAVARDGKLIVDIPDYHYPESVRKTVRLHKKLDENDFKIKIDGKDRFRVRVIEVLEGKTLTRETIVEMENKKGFLEAESAKDLSKVAVVERHNASGRIGLGFVKGFGFKEGAVASTVAHDSHNLLIIGTNDSDMAYAGNVLSEVNGGIVAVRRNSIIALVELPIAGLMSDKPVEEVVENIDRLSKAFKQLGCNLKRPFMTMSLLALPVMPELRITDKGLIDTINFRKVDLIVE